MKNETWSLGHSLDAFNDMLYGQYGQVSVGGTVEIVWRNTEMSRDSRAATSDARRDIRQVVATGFHSLTP